MIKFKNKNKDVNIKISIEYFTEIEILNLHEKIDINIIQDKGVDLYFIESNNNNFKADFSINNFDIILKHANR
ncbi:hypothetical protein O6B98_09440 [Campylobacter ureolyticus]|uniref:hypothetical protein n=1 Tax=Campylobacter ureolyticus TaxID=827 RepID=UPI0022B5D367|nr:hypothetical protein [Campylobacter ureolyticus]MCZ6166276.1 hypothetical protein [Campylobacter ureolyticus]